MGRRGPPSTRLTSEGETVVSGWPQWPQGAYLAAQ